MKKPNILLIAVDSLLSDHMSCYGYGKQTTPHIDKFAREGALFENMFSPHVPTTSGYASMLTGRDCFGTQVVALRHQGGLREDIKTLPEVLGEKGYETLCVGFGGNPASRGFQTYVEYKAWGSRDDGCLRKAEGLNEVFLPKLEEMARGDKPFFAMLRHMDPHSPYLPPQPFDRMFYHGDECDPSNESMKPVFEFKPFKDYFLTWMPPGVTDKDYEIAQYDGAVAYMDACIQRIFQQLETMGILDETIIVLTSDHGETLYDHECWFDHHGIYDVTLKVPLIIRYPKAVPMGRRVKGYVQLKHVMPTILQLAKIKTDQKFDGPSAMRLISGRAPSFEAGIYITECTWMRKHGWRTPEWKLIVALEPDFHFKPAVELYDLIRDPGETKNLAKKLPSVVAGLRERMDAFIAKRESETGKTNPVLHQPGWHGCKGIEYFESSQQAYDTLHIGDPEAARRIQAQARKGKAGR
jgi:arylsulfatase A-like enzyme